MNGMNPVDFLYSTCRERKRRKYNPDSRFEQVLFLGSTMGTKINPDTGVPYVANDLLHNWIAQDGNTVMTPIDPNKKPRFYGGNSLLLGTGYTPTQPPYCLTIKNHPALMALATGELFLRWQGWINVWGWQAVPSTTPWPRTVSMFRTDLNGVQGSQVEVLLTTAKSNNYPGNQLTLTVNWITEAGVPDTTSHTWNTEGYGTLNITLKFAHGQQPALQIVWDEAPFGTKILKSGPIGTKGTGIIARSEGATYLGSNKTTGNIGWHGLVSRFSFGNTIKEPIP